MHTNRLVRELPRRAARVRSSWLPALVALSVSLVVVVPARAALAGVDPGFILQTVLYADGEVAATGPAFVAPGTTFESTLGGAVARARGGFGTAGSAIPSVGTYVFSPGKDLDGAALASATANVLWTLSSDTLAPGTDIVAHFNLHFDAAMQTDSMRTVGTSLGLEVLDLGGNQVSNLFAENATLQADSDGTLHLSDYAGANGPSFEYPDSGIAVANRDRDLAVALQVGSTYLFSLRLSTSLAGGEYGGTVSRADAFNTLNYAFTGATLSDYATRADVSALAAIPEPATTALAMALMGLGGIAWRKWRRDPPSA